MPARHRPLVLVVDDEPLMRETIADILTEIGCDVVMAPNGASGLLVMEKHDPDLVITDVIMPVMEGIETIVEVRKRRQNIAIIAISGGGRTRRLDFLNVARKFGADAVLSKPIEPHDLEAAVRRLLPTGPR